MTEPNTLFTQLQNKPLREQVLDILRDAILNGDLKPGQTLVETELASQLGVSRAPIREALQRLHFEGLLDMIPYHATTVRKLTRRDIEELYSLRSELECFALRRMFQRGDAAALQTLREVYNEMYTAAANGDLKSVNLIDRRFHDTIIELSDHNLLQLIWNMVSLRVRQVMGLRNRYFHDLREIASNHLPIIEALEAGDIDRSAQLLREHIEQTGDLIASSWVLDANGLDKSE